MPASKATWTMLPSMSDPVLALGHGASGGAASMRPWLEALASRGVAAAAVDLPRGRAERATGAFRRVLERDPAAALGGHSFGGRVASLVAAEQQVRALVLLSYPLHRPGHPEELRTAHWPRIRCPVLLLSGERDPFARPDLLEREVARLRRAELVTYPGLGHGLLDRRDDVSLRIARFLDGPLDQSSSTVDRP